jgi:putative addiction module component (TIGR02574 family)
MSAALTAELSALSPAQKLEVIEALWESLDESVDVPAPAWHLDELKRRIAAHRNGAPQGTPWPDVKARLLRSHA